MARGTDSILYNPPAIKKPSSKSGLVKQGLFPDRAGEVLLTAGFTAFRDLAGGVRILDEEMTSDTSKATAVSGDGKIAVSGDSIVWGDNHGFVIRNFADPEEAATYKPGVPGKVLGIRLTEDALYCLWYDIKAGEVRLSGIDRVDRYGIDEGEDEWEEFRAYSSDEMVHFTDKGDSSLLLYRDEKYQEYSFAKIDEVGISGILNAHFTRVRSDAPERLIAPTEEEGEYIVAGHDWYNMPQVMLFRAKDRGSHFQGKAKEKAIFSLSDIKSEVAHDLAYSRGRGLLLGDRELVLFSKERGIIQTIDLKGDFDRLAFHGERAIIWSEKDSGYQEFRFPKD